MILYCLSNSPHMGFGWELYDAMQLVWSLQRRCQSSSEWSQVARREPLMIKTYTAKENHWRFQTSGLNLHLLEKIDFQRWDPRATSYWATHLHSSSDSVLILNGTKFLPDRHWKSTEKLLINMKTQDAVEKKVHWLCASGPSAREHPCVLRPWWIPLVVFDGTLAWSKAVLLCQTP